MTPPVICLMGPTAAGKTRLALELCRHLPCEIVSVDSALVYRGLDIGTAKPEPEVLRTVPHHLIDICDPQEAYSVGRFREDARQALAVIQAAGRIPLLVGGSGLYFRSLDRGLSSLPAADPALRARLDAEAARVGWPDLHRRLVGVDPVAARHIHPHDATRIQRALEVWELCGRPLSECWSRSQPTPLLQHAVRLALVPADRALLHRRIEARFQGMLQRGLIEEVRGLRLPADCPAARLVGYRQVLCHLRGALSRPAMIDGVLAATRGLARRQLTWLRAGPGVQWFDSGAPWPQTREQVLRHLALTQGVTDKWGVGI